MPQIMALNKTRVETALKVPGNTNKESPKKAETPK